MNIDIVLDNLILFQFADAYINHTPSVQQIAGRVQNKHPSKNLQMSGMLPTVINQIHCPRMPSSIAPNHIGCVADE